MFGDIIGHAGTCYVHCVQERSHSQPGHGSPSGLHSSWHERLCASRTALEGPPLSPPPWFFDGMKITLTPLMNDPMFQDKAIPPCTEKVPTTCLTKQQNRVKYVHHCASMHLVWQHSDILHILQGAHQNLRIVQRCTSEAHIFTCHPCLAFCGVHRIDQLLEGTSHMKWTQSATKGAWWFSGAGGG